MEDGHLQEAEARGARKNTLWPRDIPANAWPYRGQLQPALLQEHYRSPVNIHDCRMKQAPSSLFYRRANWDLERISHFSRVTHLKSGRART